MGIKIYIDISGQIQQLNMDSALGFRRSDGLGNSIYFKNELKKEIIKKYKGQVTNLIEKMHCILIYYVRNENCIIYGAVVDFTVFISEHPKNKCHSNHIIYDVVAHCFFDCIKDYLEGVKEIEICRDVDFRRLKNLLPLLFKEQNYLANIKIIQKDSDTGESLAHRITLKTFRRKKYANIILTKEMIEDVLFKFKKE